MTKNDILEGLPSNWKYTENNGFVHIRDANGNVRMKIDPPDKVTNSERQQVLFTLRLQHRVRVKLSKLRTLKMK
ncbi:hypothetical protein J2S19_004760 [Metabacillus malikii]|uniref:Transposase n=1 Tax=Metabacillus malikii TaxID=1504265 RepID=A0ABT9ZMA1_9BACI|nr:hypothetical protein [Metabacillus malikii]